MAFSFSTNLSASASASRSRGTFPTACYRDPQHFAVDLFSKRGHRRRKSACRCLVARKTNTAKTGYSQTRGPKIISVWREKVATGDWSDAKAQMTPMKRLRRQMSKIGSGGVSSGREAAPPLMINRERRNNSGPFAASVRVKFMELRPNIGHPKHIETFRFCGSACSSRAIYCNAHNAKAHASNRPKMLGTTEFQAQPLVRVA